MSRKRLEYAESYTIGWIAALPFERAAATALLDERHDSPDNFAQHENDPNAYTWGRMNGHDIVIASLPSGESGLTAATTTAEAMRFSLPHIRLGLLVGVGSGLPNLKKGCSNIDIRLGDIVVGQPNGQSAGVVQYDLAEVKDGSITRKGFLNSPPRALLQALAKLRAEHELAEPLVASFLEEMFQRYPVMAKSKGGRPSYSSPGPEHDRLFQSDCRHRGDAGCYECPVEAEISREPRDSVTPFIHYGTIASGNLTVEDGLERDAILEQLEGPCICLETEAAGLMNNWPCLVIRGIGGYSDSHGNSMWHKYAAAAAAAFAKELVAYLDSREVETAPKLIDIMERVARESRDTMEHVQKISKKLDRDDLQNWLDAPDPTVNYHEALEQHHKGTGGWFLSGKEFLSWTQGVLKFLWLSGLAGCGKTVLSSLIVSELQEKHLPLDGPLLYFFFSFREHSKQTLDNLLRSLLHQLGQASPVAFEMLYDFESQGRLKPSALHQAFFAIVKRIGTIFIVIDALDESNDREALLTWLRDLHREPCARVLVTSRDIDEIHAHMSGWMPMGGRVEFSNHEVDKDIAKYVTDLLQLDPRFRRWKDDRDAQRLIEGTIAEKARGMFRWAALQLESLQHCLARPALQRALNSLPTTLGDTYVRMLDKIPQTHFEEAIRLLQVLLGALVPIKITEAVDAVAINLEAKPCFDVANRIRVPLEISRLCPGLVLVVLRGQGSSHFDPTRPPDAQDIVQLAHFSVKEFLVSENSSNRYRGYFRLQIVDSIMAKLCMSYVLDTFQDLILDEMIRIDYYPLATYCSDYWFVHARKAEHCDEEVRGLQLRLLSDDCIRSTLALVQAAWISHPAFHHLYRGTHFSNPLSTAVHCGLKYAAEHFASRQDLMEPQGVSVGLTQALVLASSMGYVSILQSLLRQNERIRGWESPAIRQASKHGHVEVVRLVLARSTETHELSAFATQRALETASALGYTEIVDLLLDCGVDVNGSKALVYAHEGCHKEITDKLISRGAGTGEEGHSVFVAACERGFSLLVDRLISNGAEVRMRNDLALRVVLNRCQYWDIGAGLPEVDVVYSLVNAGSKVDDDSGRAMRRLFFPKHFDGKPIKLPPHYDHIDILVKAGALPLGPSAYFSNHDNCSEF